MIAGGDVLIRIKLDLAGELFTEGIGQTLTRTGNFRVDEVLPGTVEAKARVCVMGRPDVLLLGVSLIDGYTIEQRERLIRTVRPELPNCKIVLLVNESMSDSVTARVKALKTAGVIDGFLYTSVSLDYLTAMLETIIDPRQFLQNSRVGADAATN